MNARRTIALGAAMLGLAGCQAEDPNLGKPVTLAAKTPPLAVSRISPVSAAPALPTPPPPSLAALDQDATLTGREAGMADVELPKLLGELWYPDATLSLHSERGKGHVGKWPKVTLLAPEDEKIQGVLDYYELRFPGGERESGEYAAAAKRTGDDAPTRIRVYRANKGFAAGRIVILIQA